MTGSHLLEDITNATTIVVIETGRRTEIGIGNKDERLVRSATIDGTETEVAIGELRSLKRRATIAEIEIGIGPTQTVKWHVTTSVAIAMDQRGAEAEAVMTVMMKDAEGKVTREVVMIVDEDTEIANMGKIITESEVEMIEKRDTENTYYVYCL
jgi:hypothetical protein